MDKLFTIKLKKKYLVYKCWFYDEYSDKLPLEILRKQ